MLLQLFSCKASFPILLFLTRFHTRTGKQVIRARVRFYADRLGDNNILSSEPVIMPMTINII